MATTSTKAVDHLPFSYGKNEIPLKQFQNINLNNFVRSRRPPLGGGVAQQKSKRRLSPEKEPPIPSRNVKTLPKHLIGRVNSEKSKSKFKVVIRYLGLSQFRRGTAVLSSIL